MDNKRVLRSFVIVHKGKIVTPELTTTRELGRFWHSLYDGNEDILDMFIYTDKHGKEHPGTLIINYLKKLGPLRKHYLEPRAYKSSTQIYEELVKYGMSSPDDLSNLAGDDTTREFLITHPVLFVGTFMRWRLRNNSFNIHEYHTNPIVINSNEPVVPYSPNYSATQSIVKPLIKSSLDDEKEVEFTKEITRKKISKVKENKKLKASIRMYDDGQEFLNLLDDRFEYINLKCNVQKRELYIEQGKPDECFCKIMKRKAYYLGNNRVLRDKFSDLKSGYYELQFDKSKNRFIIFLNNYIEKGSAKRIKTELKEEF